MTDTPKVIVVHGDPRAAMALGPDVRTVTLKMWGARGAVALRWHGVGS